MAPWSILDVQGRRYGAVKERGSIDGGDRGLSVSKDEALHFVLRMV